MQRIANAELIFENQRQRNLGYSFFINLGININKKFILLIIPSRKIIQNKNRKLLKNQKLCDIITPVEEIIMEENVKLELACMFDRKDKEIQKIIEVEANKELKKAYEKLQAENENRTKQARINTIETLTDDEIKLVVKLHMDRIIKEYEKQSKSMIDIIVR